MALGGLLSISPAIGVPDAADRVRTRAFPVRAQERPIGPAGRPPNPAAVSQAHPRYQWPETLIQDCRVLVVDDEETIRDVVGDALQLEGYPVDRAANGVEALQVVDRAPPSLVLLDMRMPVLDGWGFTQEFRRRGFNTPIIVITAAQNARRWAEEIGAAAYLAKPFDLDDLVRLVQRYCEAT